METLQSTTKSPNEMNLNRRNSRGETILVTSIRKGKPNSFIIYLIRSGCDVNIATKKGETPLHLAVSRRTTKVARALIKAGANLNAVDKSKECPIHYAILDDKLEMVDMLLYYGADINIWSSYNRTPLMLAAEMLEIEIFKTLIQYYEASSYITQQNEHFIVTRLDSLNFNSSWMVCEDTFFLRLSMHCGIPKLFKLIWNRVDHKKLLVGEKPFLVTYWSSKLPSFTTSEWLECLNLILNSPCAELFVDHCKNYKHLYLPELIQAFNKHETKKHDIIAVLYLLFLLGVEVCCSDLDWVRLNYGFNEEFEACIYAGNYRGRISDVDCDSPFLTFIFGLEEDCSIKRVFELFKHWPPNLCHYCQFFSLYPDMKSELQDSWNEKCRAGKIMDTYGKASMFYTADISEELSQMNELPSLLELSRNATQNWIRQKYGDNIQKPYDFHDVVKGLNLPEKLKDVVIFKRPLYTKKICDRKFSKDL